MNILRKKEVLERIGLSSVSVWRLEKEGNFPQRIKLGKRSVGWREDDINAWLESRPRVIGGKVCA